MAGFSPRYDSRISPNQCRAKNLTLCDGVHGGHEPGVEPDLDVEALVALGDEDGLLGAHELVGTQPLEVVDVALAARAQKVIVRREFGVLEESLVLQFGVGILLFYVVNATFSSLICDFSH